MSHYDDCVADTKITVYRTYVLNWKRVSVASHSVVKGNPLRNAQEARAYFQDYIRGTKKLKAIDCKFRELDGTPDDKCRWYYP